MRNVRLKVTRKAQATNSVAIGAAIADALGYGQFYSRSHDAVIRVYEAVSNVIETHEHRGDFKEP